MKNEYIYVLLVVFFFGFTSCEKESDGGNPTGGSGTPPSNCVPEYSLSTSVIPTASGVINHNSGVIDPDDLLFCLGDSVLVTAVPHLHYEFVEWGNLGFPSASELENPRYVVMNGNQPQYVNANFQIIDTSYISSSLNVLLGFPCDPDQYPRCYVNVTNNNIQIGTTASFLLDEDAYTTRISFYTFSPIETGKTYSLDDPDDPPFQVTCWPQGGNGESYDLPSSVAAGLLENPGSITVNVSIPDLKRVELTFNDLKIFNIDGDLITLFGTVYAQGI